MAKKDELLVCNCEDDANHIMYTDHNQEAVIECTKCKRSLKFPKDDKTSYKGKVKKLTATEHQQISSNDMGKLEDVLTGGK